MEKKIVSLFIVFSFSVCILCTPVFSFISRFYSGSEAFQSVKTNGFSMDVSFSGNTASNLDTFTKNIKAPNKKSIDFSSNLALMPSSVSVSAQKSIKDTPNFLKSIDFTSSSNLFSLDRLRMRTHQSQNASPLFVLFILLYIGMLRSVFVFSKNYIFYIKKPLFAQRQTEVFHLWGSYGL